MDVKRLPFFLFCAVLSAAPAAEFIFEQAPFASSHASTIVQLKNGALMAAWFGGTEEGAADVAIWASVKAGAGQAWSAPVEVAREEKIATYNPVLFHTKDGRLWLYYKFGPSPERWSAARKFSSDDGKTWSPAEYLPAGLLGPIRSKPVVLQDGSIVSGSSVESYRTWAAWIERSTDNGQTWTKFGPIVVPDAVAASAGAPPAPRAALTEWDRTRGIIQPSVVTLAGNRLRFYARSTSKIGKICIADSADGGKTWTQARPLELPNPNAGVDAVMLNDGRIVLLYNHSDRRRTPLTLAVSKDGEKFTQFATVESDNGEFSYPAIIQGSDGALHMTYTWNRKRIKYVRVPLEDVP